MRQTLIITEEQLIKQAKIILLEVLNNIRTPRSHSYCNTFFTEH